MKRILLTIIWLTCFNGWSFASEEPQKNALEQAVKAIFKQADAQTVVPCLVDKKLVGTFKPTGRQGSLVQRAAGSVYCLFKRVPTPTLYYFNDGSLELSIANAVSLQGVVPCLVHTKRLRQDFNISLGKSSEKLVLIMQSSQVEPQFIKNNTIYMFEDDLKKVEKALEEDSSYACDAELRLDKSESGECANSIAMMLAIIGKKPLSCTIACQTDIQADKKTVATSTDSSSRSVEVQTAASHNDAATQTLPEPPRRLARCARLAWRIGQAAQAGWLAYTLYQAYMQPEILPEEPASAQEEGVSPEATAITIHRQNEPLNAPGVTPGYVDTLSTIALGAVTQIFMRVGRFL